MNDSLKPQLPTTQELLAIVNSEDFLILAIKGHQCVDAILNKLISELLYDPHSIELTRLSLMLKVDLSKALGHLSRSYRPALEKINKIRNMFAHDKNAILKRNEGLELLNSLPNHIRKYILKRNKNKPTEYDILQGATALLYVNLEARFDNIKKAKLYDRVSSEMIEQRMSEIWMGKDDELEKGASAIHQEIEARVRKLLETQ